MALVCFAGEVDEAPEVFRPFRELAEPLADMMRPIPYPQMYPPDEPDYHPTAVARTMFIDTVDRSVAETIVEHLQASDASLRVAQLESSAGRSPGLRRTRRRTRTGRAGSW